MYTVIFFSFITHSRESFYVSVCVCVCFLLICLRSHFWYCDNFQCWIVSCRLLVISHLVFDFLELFSRAICLSLLVFFFYIFFCSNSFNFRENWMVFFLYFLLCSFFSSFFSSFNVLTMVYMSFISLCAL